MTKVVAGFTGLAIFCFIWAKIGGVYAEYSMVVAWAAGVLAAVHSLTFQGLQKVLVVVSVLTALGVGDPEATRQTLGYALILIAIFVYGVILDSVRTNQKYDFV